jgi:hypothetical protein
MIQYNINENIMKTLKVILIDFASLNFKYIYFALSKSFIC